MHGWTISNLTLRPRENMYWTRIVCCALSFVALNATQAEEPPKPLTLVVMDPLAAPLSCPCVEGYAQRDYQAFAERLGERLGRAVKVGFGGSLERGLLQAGVDEADLIVGKDSVVRADAVKRGVRVTPLARLTGKDGATTQTGLIVVRSDDPATDAAGLTSYRVFFGPADCDEKHAAALRLIADAGAKIAPPRQEDISDACSDGACKVIELGPEVRSAAVISSYAQPLLEGCGTVLKGDLKVVAETEPVPFITAFATERLDPDESQAVLTALMSLNTEPETLRALESMLGFMPVGDEYHELVESASQLPDGMEPAADKEPSSVEETAPSASTEWPGWGGPSGDGNVAQLPDTLDGSPAVVWSTPLMRSGLGGAAVSGGKVVLGDRDLTNAMDVWRCYDALTGAPLWRWQYPAPGQLDYDNSPRATPLIADDRAYLLGAFGHLTCVRLSDGVPLWRRDLRADFGARDALVWGLCASPVLVDGRLIVGPGASDAAWVALDPSTGAELWRVGGDRHGFATPVVATLGGVRQLVVCDRTSIVGLRVETGELLWRLKPPRPGDFNVPTPLVIGGRLFAVSENNGARLYRFAEGGVIDPEPVALYADLLPDTSSPVALGERVYCVWNSLFCLDAAGGRLAEEWVGEDPALPDAGAIVAGRTRGGADRLLVVARGGELLLVDPAGDAMRVVARQNLFGADLANAEELLTSPAIAGGRLYLRGESRFLCVELAMN